MNIIEVEHALETVALARKQWAEAQNQFNAEVERTMKRLIHEAAANRMSVQHVAKVSGYTTQQIKTRMKRMGLSQATGKTLLAKTASDAIHSNAELLGVNPSDIDLLSPLAYLEGGKGLLARTRSDRSVEVDEA